MEFHYYYLLNMILYLDLHYMIIVNLLHLNWLILLHNLVILFHINSEILLIYHLHNLVIILMIRLNHLINMQVYILLLFKNKYKGQEETVFGNIILLSELLYCKSI